MKQLTDNDIQNMVHDAPIGVDAQTARDVRRQLHLSTRIHHPTTIPEHTTIDFHNHTEQESWDMLIRVATSGTRSATVITGASGILKPKFQQWVAESVLSPYIVSCTPLNNGSFAVKFKKQKN